MYISNLILHVWENVIILCNTANDPSSYSRYLFFHQTWYFPSSFRKRCCNDEIIFFGHYELWQLLMLWIILNYANNTSQLSKLKDTEMRLNQKENAMTVLVLAYSATSWIFLVWHSEIEKTGYLNEGEILLLLPSFPFARCFLHFSLKHEEKHVSFDHLLYGTATHHHLCSFLFV